MKPTLKYLLFILLLPSASLLAQEDDYNFQGFRRFHFTLQVGYYKNRVDDILTRTFANDLYEGSRNLLVDYVIIGGGPEDASGFQPVINAALEVSINHRFKMGIGVNGVSQTHVIGFVNKDSIINYPHYFNTLYDRVDETVHGSTLKLQAIYALKPYHGDIGVGWEFDIGAGFSYNMVNIKQEYLLQSVDSVTQETISANYQTEMKASSVGAFFLSRVDVHLTRGFSLTGDFNWMFDTGVKVDETHFNFYDTTRKIDAHNIKFDSFLVAVGTTWHF